MNERESKSVIEETPMQETEYGLVPDDDDWRVVHASEAQWLRSGRHRVCRLEGEARFPQFGINVRVLEPGQPACMYHAENLQEDFLVLSGECVLVIEEQERRLEAGHFVHCPPDTRHVFVGAGAGPCVILMIGARSEDTRLLYPVSEVARAHGASVEVETMDLQEAYAGWEMPRPVVSPGWPPR